jgi:hypothetical protein
MAAMASSETVSPLCSRSWTSRVSEQRLWKIRQLATRWLYLMALRCSSRLFSAMMPSPPKKVHLRKRLRASLLLVAPWMVDRSCASEM